AVGENSGFTRMRTNKAIWGFPECVLKCRDAGNGDCEVQVETFCEMQNKTKRLDSLKKSLHNLVSLLLTQRGKQ
ncbi:hypothetical protein, partial [Bordetella sp. 02P26C-1]|uniref:hypothetical protein n=1 Tax=Bordetella sp. 02P26C-1 TaxID=2683195 RepID=UPI001F28D9BC